MLEFHFSITPTSEMWELGQVRWPLYLANIAQTSWSRPLGNPENWEASLVWYVGSSSSCLWLQWSPGHEGPSDHFLHEGPIPVEKSLEEFAVAPMSHKQYKWLSVWGNERCLSHTDNWRAGRHYFFCFLKESSMSFRNYTLHNKECQSTSKYIL